jgi:hypothetical protein
VDFCELPGTSLGESDCAALLEEGFGVPLF